MKPKLPLANARRMPIRWMVLILLGILIQTNANAYAQGKINLSVKNTEITNVLSTIESQTRYHFIYNGNTRAMKQKVTLSVQDADIKEVLDQVLKRNGLSYQILENDLIAISDAAANTSASAADKMVTGTVTGDNNQPLAGVSVQVKGSTRGTTTNENGQFALSVPENAVLVISYVGYQSQEVSTANGTSIKVTLVAATSPTLNEVVVVGYGTQRKRDLTGSITSIKGDDVAKLPATNPISSLQGRVAGLTIVNSGVAGAGPTVRIRGVNSTNNSDPLYVVDGVFQTNIDYLNPADIENIEVLRDPSSIAIFGLQGGNGVIIVTTRRAAKGTTRVSLQSQVGVQSVTNKIDVVDAAGFKKLYSAQLQNLNAAPFDFTNYLANTDWQSLILRDAVMSNNNLSISTSGEKSTTLFNLGYNTQEGVLKGNRYQKFIGRINQEIRLSSKIKIGGDVTGFHWINESSSADLNNALWAAPIVPVQVDSRTYYSMPSFQRAQVGNPVARMNQNNNTAVNKGFRFVGSMFGEVKLRPFLTWRSAFYTDLGFNNSRNYTPLPFRYVNLGEGAAATDTTFDATARTSISQSQAEFRKFQQDHTLTFDKTFNDNHKITAMVGFTTLYQGSVNVNGNRRDTSLNIPNDPDYWYLSIANQANPGTYNGGGGEESYMSYFGRVNYAYAGKYLVNATVRRDGSSKFSTNNRWGTFGSVGVGWVISEEKFFDRISKINFLKLRGAWGTVGSGLGLPANLFRPNLTQANVGVFGDNVYPSVSPAYIPDPNLHWEVVRGVDVGIDLGAFKNRLTAELTFYDRKTKDILTTVLLPSTAGDYSYRTNLGTISNKGVEFSAGWRDRIGRDFTYSVSGNVSYNKNKVESIGNNINFQILGNGGVNKTETGQSIGYFYGYVQTGIYQSVAQMDKMPTMPTSLPGDISFQDVNGDGIIDGKDRTYLGTPFPTYNFGFNVNLGYKGFDLLVEGQGVAGNKIYTQRRNATFAVLNFESNRLNAWTGAGTSNVEPILDNTRGNNYLFSTYFLEPGDYFRIRTLQLGYTLNKKMLDRIKFQQVRVFLSGQNIATFTKATGYTPEAPLGNPISSGADNGIYPVPAVYSFGINVTF